MGSNMAENHPVAFQWVVDAQRNGARVIHVDPRFTRTSALADTYVPLRPGSDLAFLGGLINYILDNGHQLSEYVAAYTNADVIISDEVALPDDLVKLLSGYDPDSQTYDASAWRYAGLEQPVVAASGKRGRHPDRGGGETPRGREVEEAERDPTLSHPRCVFQLLKRHYAGYTPERVAELCGVSREQFVEVAEALCANSGREATSAFVYSVGWTQHTVGAQYIRAASIVQLLLGNVGRPGGGILALRGHASIQGSTDIPTLYDLLPGYLPMPQAAAHPDMASYLSALTAHKGFWGDIDAYLVSLLKAWWGEAARADNDFAYGWLPKLSGDHSTYRTTLAMLDGDIAGYLLLGQNPAVGSSNGRLHRLAMANLDWLVVRDLVEIESATFWRDSPEVESGELDPGEIATEVFFLPAAAHTEKDGSFTNTQRLLQWHEKAVEPAGDCRSDLWFVYHLGRRIRAKLAERDDPTDLAVRELTWDYPVHGPLAEPSAEAVLAEINGVDAHGEPLAGFAGLAADGSTACGCWIYAGCYAEGVNQPARRTPRWDQDATASRWGWAWPDNRRILYNRASADPAGRPWSQRTAYMRWDAEQGAWVGPDRPDFPATRPPDYAPPADAAGPAALRGDDAFVMQSDGKAWLYAPDGMVDGPLPTHYEPHESPVRNGLHAWQASPARQRLAHPHDPDNPGSTDPAPGPPDPFGPHAPPFPFAITTYRIAEHHTAGGMSRFGRRLTELAPELFVEVDPVLAQRRGLVHGGWATVLTARSAVEARVMVTDRLRPLPVGGGVIHQVGVPYHFGYGGRATGDAGNDLLSLALDPNVHISEYKAATCDIRPGRRPRGEALRRMVDEAADGHHHKGAG